MEEENLAQVRDYERAANCCWLGTPVRVFHAHADPVQLIYQEMYLLRLGPGVPGVA